MTELLQSLAALGETLPAWVVQATVWSGVVLVAIALCDLMLHRWMSPAWRMVLYVTVFVRAALPVDWTAPFGVWRTAWLTPPAQRGGAGGGMAESAPLELISTTAPPLEVGVQVSAPGAASLSGLAWIGLYFAVAFALLAFRRWRRRSLVRDLVQAEPADPRVCSAMPASCGTRRPAVLVHEHLGPLAIGTRRAIIVLPRTLTEALDDGPLSCILAHELAHHRRHDPGLVRGLGLATALLWPVIPVWLAASRMRQLMELAADEMALEHAKPELYGRTLIDLASRPLTTPGYAAAIAPGTFWRLRARIVAIAHRRWLPQPVQVGFATVVCAVVMACAGLDEGEVDDPVASAQRCESWKAEATRQHDASERNADAQAVSGALQAYDAYAEACETDAEYAKMLYYRAELYWSVASRRHASGDVDGAREAFALAQLAFERALAQRPEGFTKDAAYGNLLAQWNALDVELDLAAPPAGSGEPSQGEVEGEQFPRSDYTARELALLRTYADYQAHVDDPTDDGLQKILYHRAKLAMDHNRFDEAEAAARELLDGSDGSVAHVRVAEMLTDILTIRWVRASGESEQEVAAQLGDWLTRVRGSSLYGLEEAKTLREAVPRLEAGLVWKSEQAGD